MKKLLLLTMLTLALLLTACSTPKPAEPEATQTPEDATLSELGVTAQALDFSDFKMAVFNVDGVDMRTKADGALWAIIYPLYDQAAAFHDTITVTWAAEDVTPVLTLVGAENYAATTVEQSLAGYAASGVTASNARLLSAVHENSQMALYYTVDLDYSGMGTPLQQTVHQMQFFHLRGEDGTYIFTLTADSAADLQMLSYYLGTVSFPADAQ